MRLPAPVHQAQSPALFLALIAVTIALLGHFWIDNTSLDTVTFPYRPLPALLASSNLTTRDDFSCDLDNPCSNGACCGESGYCGYGPTYCGDGCISQCDAIAECGEYAVPAGKTCPLNVCCSQYGFCGTTTDFCDDKCQSNCIEHPEPPASGNQEDVRKRVIGYYEAWSARRDCHPIDPSMLPVDRLTHVNFAFASIDPETYEITTMDSATPADLFQAAADIKTFKSGNADLEVFVSIGGWTFSDNDTVTQPLFGEIARDSTKRQTFADNVVKFLDQYGFDGLDVDWEYPGAPDRGGQEDDTKNFVLLLKTLRETFDSRPRSLGLTFTVPTSYWYLRWFDLPGSVPYVDWINYMSYDLHGFWDRNNPIGSIVQGHTNLTEIKAAAELLWRVEIPPEKVVMGVGFYGRSFQLSDPTCSQPSCPFGGAANAGDCTDTGGILGYFEIMDIINGIDSLTTEFDTVANKQLRKRVTIAPTHDEEAAVNYFTFDDDQWVSYDDNVTFQQKVDWANDLGLGGLMIWSADLDDKLFTATSGLVGQQVIGGTGGAHDAKSVEQHWSGQNGQLCRRDSGCVRVDWEGQNWCGDGETLIGWDAADCGKNKGQPICCPVAAYPRKCTWRGGAHGGPLPQCDGQCHTDEVTLFDSKRGGGPGIEGTSSTDTTKCFAGRKVFCCVADTWAGIIGQCKFGRCGGGCDHGYTNVTWKHDPQVCAYPIDGSGPQNRDYCCPLPQRLNNCHWIGQGDCGDNSCDNDDVVLMTDHYGQSKHTCHWGRQKVCCCDSPKELTFLPFDINNLFPEAPSLDINKIQWDITYPKGAPANGDSNRAAFGMVVIDGPQNAVASAKVKRDGSKSDLEFLDCHAGMKRDDRHTVRFVCKSNGDNSDCDDMMSDGLAGTILELPTGCGETYGVAHSVEKSANQTLPAHLMDIHNTTVLELTFDYDFGLVKRDGGDIYFRVDYANVPGYWNEVVKASPATRSLDRRFWSNDVRAWSEKFSSWLSQPAFGTEIEQKDIKKSLFSNAIDCDSDSAYVDIKASGSVEASARMAISIIGTISPQIKVEEVYAVLNTTIDANFLIENSIYGNLRTPKTTLPMFAPKTADEFNHIGLVSIAPTLQIDVDIYADIELAGNFTTGVHAFTSESIVQGWPKVVRPPTGQTDHQALANPFAGSIDSVDRPGVLEVSLVPRVGMQISLNKYDTDGEALHALIESRFDTTNIVEVDSETFNVSMQTSAAGRNLEYTKDNGVFPQWESDNTGTAQTIGDTPTAKTLLSGSPGGDPGDDGPAAHDIEFDSTAVFAGQKDVVLACPANLEEECQDVNYNCAFDICSYELNSCDDDDSFGEPATGGEEDDEVWTPQVKSASREFIAKFWDRTQLAIESQSYPSIGTLFDGNNGAQVLQVVFDYLSESVCSDVEVLDTPRDDVKDMSRYVTEHVLELQTIKSFLEAAVSGKLTSGTTMKTTNISSNFFRSTWNQKSLPTNLPAVVSANKLSPSIPNDRVFEAMGSTRNRKDFVACRKELNSIKAKIWSLQDPRDQNGFEADVQLWIYNCKNPAEFLKYLKAAQAVFFYLTDADVQGRTQNTIANVRTQLDYIEKKAKTPTGTSGKGLTTAWDEFIEDFLNTITNNTKAWLFARINYVQQEIARIPKKRIPKNLPQKVLLSLNVEIPPDIKAEPDTDEFADDLDLPEDEDVPVKDEDKAKDNEDEV